MKIKIFLMIAMYCCVTNAMDAPVAPRTVEQFDSSVSFKLPGSDSPLNRVQQGLANIVLAKNLRSKVGLDLQELGINAVACQPDGTLFASACNNSTKLTVTIFSPYGDSPASCKSGDETSIACATFSSDGAKLLCGSGRNLYFWDTKSWKFYETSSLDTICDVHALAFSKSGQKIIVGGGAGKNNLAILTKKPDGCCVRELSGHENGAISCVGFSPDGMRAVSVCESEFRVWDTANAIVLYEDRGKAWSNCKVEYDQRGGWVLTGCDHLLGWWFLHDLNIYGKKIIIPLLKKKLPKIKAYDRSSCGNYIFLGSAQANQIFVFNLYTKQWVYTIDTDGTISTIACSPNGTFMAYAVKRSDGKGKLYLHRETISAENRDALQAVYSIAGEQLELVERLIKEVAVSAQGTTALGDTDHVTFDGLPLLLKELLLEYVLPKEKMDEHDFTLLERSVIIQPHKDDKQSEDDEWTLIN